MKNVIDNLYDKYNTDVATDLEGDEFYQYFYNLLETGTTLCQFYNRKLIKEVDEQWVNEIEAAMQHIQNVVENPRKFIEEDRQIVNVAVAKKFTAESVRHLSQHSEMVSRIHEDGTVEPSKVLNVFKEESLNTYENRFIYTLLLELRNFINKRFDQLFDSSRDEDGVKLDLESVIDNYSEIVSYKLELRIREKQTDTSNDEENVNIFTRITQIHKTVMELTSSGFMLEMQKYPLVKHPVVKTNAIAKHPDYKACYKLWNFLHAYDRVGYKVQVLEQDPIVSGDFERSLYNQILMDYVVVRKYMEYRDLLNINRPKKKKSIGINTVKQFVNDLVNEYDMTASELRKLVENELDNALKNKERVDKMQQELQRRNKGFVDIADKEDGWSDFATTDESHKKKDPQTQAKERAQQRENAKIKSALKDLREKELDEKKKLLEERKQAIAQGVKQTDYYDDIEDEVTDEELDRLDDKIVDVVKEFVDLEKLTSGGIKIQGYANSFIENEVITDARFSKLVRQIDKAKKKREFKEQLVQKKYEEVAKSDVDRAKKILDRAKLEKDRRTKKNETARLHQIEKQKQEQKKARLKAERKQFKIQSELEKKAAKQKNKERTQVLRQEAKLAAEERRRTRLLEQERAKLAKAQKREDDKQARIEARKQAAIQREQLKIHKKEISQAKAIEKAKLRQQKAIARAADKERQKQAKQKAKLLAAKARQAAKDARIKVRLEKKKARQEALIEKKRQRQQKKEANKLLKDKKRQQKIESKAQRLQRKLEERNKKDLIKKQKSKKKRR